MPEDQTHAHAVEQREQPFLYSWNRRLRHLHGVSLRNINLSLPAGRSKGKITADDDYNLNTPTKALAEEEYQALHHVRSSDQLSRSETSLPKGISKASTSHENSGMPTKRPGGKLRRRSTLHWSSSNPRTRQQKLEDVAMDRMVDTWFSLHHDAFDKPIYISEVMEKSMNPSFSFFDLDPTVAAVSRADHFEIKVWSKNSRMDEYRLLVRMRVHLKSLQYVGKSLEHFHHPLPQNCVLLHLFDGIYTSFTDLPSEDDKQPHLTQAMKSMSPLYTASFDALMQLANLDDCIQDALQVRSELEGQINNLLADQQENRRLKAEIQTRQSNNKAVNLAIDTERKRIDDLSKSIKTIRDAHDRRRKLKAEAIGVQQVASVRDEARKRSAMKLQEQIVNNTELASGQLRRICGELQHLFPIEPVKNRTLQFTIRHIHLPNSVFDDTNRDEIAAALGYTAQLVHHLSLYLSIILPYQIELGASNSFICDNISLSLAQRKFPLYPTNVNYKFEYGVFLLNKDIEFLMNRMGLRVLDIRHTLPNLKYLSFVMTAGSGELPARKAGGIRGLLGDRMSPYMSRRGSQESVQSLHVRNSSIDSMVSKEKPDDIEDHRVMPTATKALAYRRSLLREAG